MPIFEYRCARCGACGGAALTRVPTAGRVLRGGASGPSACDPSSRGWSEGCGGAPCAGGTCGLA